MEAVRFVRVNVCGEGGGLVVCWRAGDGERRGEG